MDSPTPASSAHRRPRTASRAALLALLLLVQLATSLYQLPLNRLIERRLCDEFYRDGRSGTGGSGRVSSAAGEIDETLCKVDAVQQQLAWILGAMETAWIVGDFIMAIPLGFAAEALGQRAVLWLNLVPRIFMLAWAPIIGLGFGESLPITAIIAAPFLSFLGGDCVFSSITYSLAAGSTDDYVSRATLFGYMSSITYVTNLLGPGLASATMSGVLWLPFVIGICLLLLAIPTTALLPEPEPKAARQTRHGRQDDTDERQPFLPSSPLLKAARTSPATGSSSTAYHYSSLLQSQWTRTKTHISALLRTISRGSHAAAAAGDHNNHKTGQIPQQPQQNLPLLLASFLLTALASSDTKLLPQYISKRHGWRFASVGYLLSCKAVVNFILLVFIVPRVLRRGPERRDSPETHAGGDEDEDTYDGPDPTSISTPDTAAAAAAAETRTNIAHARICLGVSLLGALLIACASSVALLLPALGVYALGSALPVFTLSLLKSPFVVPHLSSTSPPGLALAAGSASAGSPATSPSTMRGAGSSLSSYTTPGGGHGTGSSDAQDDLRQGSSGGANTETQLFAVVMMVKTLGSLLGAPLMATLWVRGISIGGAALGIPYLVSAACYGAAIGVFAMITVP
ncbi:hypothetical protein Micbo1qcDRAFT_235174 [Microdochium bolleyi]|uniref:Major facilitator superfamily domain-containing protein n=1 Tax=Microdochium bolleyi TaxID=196109 RepID=A0A136IX40_9PEZI|nr:hypothetical protein Micbo1qcDRAFT_235174 [Microdochium bolleyi]